MEIAEIPDTVGALSSDTIVLGCPLCQHAGSKPMRKLDELEAELSGRVAPAEMYRAMVESYKVQVRPLLQHGRVCPKVTVDHCRVHYTQHRVNVCANLAKEIVYMGILQEHFRKHEMCQKTSEGERINPRVLDSFIKVSKHKLELIKQFRSMAPKIGDAPTAYKFN